MSFDPRRTFDTRTAYQSEDAQARARAAAEQRTVDDLADQYRARRHELPSTLAEAMLHSVPTGLL